MTVSINGTNGLVFNDGSSQTTAAKNGMINRIINGAMVIDQRNAGASVSASGTWSYPVDRFGIYATLTSKFTGQQSTTAPAGFINSLLITSSAATTPGASDQYLLKHVIEGFNVADFGFGTANAAVITFSFWVRSSVTGTFSGAFKNGAGNRSYVFTYSISAANTWEQKTISITGDTSGTWLTGNGAGLQIWFDLGGGSTYRTTAGSWVAGDFQGATGAVNLVGTNGATFYITGVQLEKGSTATSFDYRPYGTELALCQRYYALIRSGASGVTQSSAAITVGWKNPVEMRASPTIALYSTTLVMRQDGAASFTSSGSTMPDYSADTFGGWAVVNGFTGLTTTRSAITFPTTAAFTLSAEL